MHEAHRQTYLSVLGVDSYVPRWILPVAPKPVACILPNVSSAVTKNDSEGQGENKANLVETKTVPSSVVEKGDVVLDKLPLNLSEKPTTAKAHCDSMVSSPSATTMCPRFALSLWRVSDDLIVVDTRQSQLALPTDNLLANMLFALGYRLPRLPKAEILRWPLLENNAAQQGETEAREMLQTYMDAHLSAQSAQYLLLMGVDAAQYLLPQQLNGDLLISEHKNNRPNLTFGDTGVNIIVTHSLATLLQKPELKAQTWQSIQPLRLVE